VPGAGHLQMRRWSPARRQAEAAEPMDRGKKRVKPYVPSLAPLGSQRKAAVLLMSLLLMSLFPFIHTKSSDACPRRC